METKVKVLIVDDDYYSLILFASSLRNYQTYKEIDSRKAVEKFLAIKPSVIIVDYAMPFVGGPEVAKNIKEIDRNCKIVMMCTSVHSKEELAEYCDAFLLKPISPLLINQTIDQLVLSEN